jgi:hypothetical protein
MLTMPETKLMFGEMVQEPWPYERSMGVGICMQGRPRDAYDFLDAIQGSVCRAEAAHLILRLLESGESYRATVTPSVKFGYLAAMLDQTGVSLTIIPPKVQPHEDHQQRMNFDELVENMLLGVAPPSSLDPESRALLEQRCQALHESLMQTPHNYNGWPLESLPPDLAVRFRQRNAEVTDEAEIVAPKVGGRRRPR